MEFVDYSYYSEVYCGSLSEEEFSRVFPKAMAYFYGATRGRVKEADTSVCFSLCEGDELKAVYAYCNLHSLWKA